MKRLKAFLFNREWCGYNICGCGCMSWFSIFMGLLARSHKFLLDLLVRTDTLNVVRLFSRGVGRGGRGCTDPLFPSFLRCPLCGRSLRLCDCRSSADYVL